MDILSTLSQLKKKAATDEALRDHLIRAGGADKPLAEFCKIARLYGFDLYEMDLIDAGVDFYAQMKRSQNGGGENSPMLENASDYFEAFLEELKQLKSR